MSIIPALRRPRQKEFEFMASLGFIVSSRLAWAVRPCLKKTKIRNHKPKQNTGLVWWLIPVVLATQDTEIGRIVV
jgi:hypothetical protein